MATVLTPQEEALENLKVIRSLMERANVYRALSASAALFGGLLAVAASVWGYRHDTHDPGTAPSPLLFVGTWLVILFLSGALNVFLLAHDARKRGQPFVSDGLRMALRGLCPPLISGGVLGIALIVRGGLLTPAALVWIICYGLALQATISFAPKSLIRLARAFLVSGQALTLAWMSGLSFGDAAMSGPSAWLLMGLTFGFGHIVYALCVFANRSSQS